MLMVYMGQVGRDVTPSDGIIIVGILFLSNQIISKIIFWFISIYIFHVEVTNNVNNWHLG